MALIFSTTLLNLPAFSFADAEAVAAVNSRTDKLDKGYKFFHEEYIHSYQGFSIKICNSECEEPQTCPLEPGTDMEEVRSTDIQRPPQSTGTPREPQPRLLQSPQRRAGEPPSSHSAEALGSCCDKPTGPAGSRLRPSRCSQGPRDPRPRDISLPKQRPERAQGSRPRQVATGSESAQTKAPSPGHREPQVHQQAETPTTGRYCGGGEIGPTFDGGPKLIQKREHPRPNLTQKTDTHSHNHTFPTSCVHSKNTHTHAPVVKTNNNGRRTLNYTQVK
ncbi:hypothetical protein ATANTOWER_026865 [Ataeniobius toweri]|uniref:Uncharacterized protein n=1 Tax=Ataeniobius toweri TaxID=208326 RepID=A0ABU7ATG5_9TELE|nr:hypothetical protein [Ataeniobius toweri]